MIHYILIEPSTGRVVQRGTCSQESEIPVMPGLVYERVAPEDSRRPQTSIAPTYRDFRAMEYPSVGDQLDALWKAIDAGDMQSAASMLARVKAVKDKYPKE